jgi:electron transfer flavoprotein alpha subunit
MPNEVWTFCEQKENILREVSFELLAWGRKLADIRKTTLCAVVFANGMPAEELNHLIQQGADKVYVVQNEAFTNFLVEPQVHTLLQLIKTYQPEIVLAGATTTGRTVMPYLAMKLHTGLTADCTGLEIEEETGNLLQIRPAIGGNIMATIKTPDTRPQMSTVRPKSICALDPDFVRSGEIITVEVPAENLSSRMRIEKFITESRGNVGLEEANIVVSAGMSMQSAEAIQQVQELTTILGGALGSSRPPVDQGVQPYARQVGLSGRTISPALYVACGISGAVQHLAGIQTAKNIVAVNKDSEAPIFQVADFGIIGDAQQILPVLTKHIEDDL